jgi:Family of unknown function (DUF6328)
LRGGLSGPDRSIGDIEETVVESSPAPDADRGSSVVAAGRRETSRERLDRNLEELTGELRVIVTGVQVLVAFLLIVPFDSGFAHVGSFERAVYFVTSILAALPICVTHLDRRQFQRLGLKNEKARITTPFLSMRARGLEPPRAFAHRLLRPRSSAQSP